MSAEEDTELRDMVAQTLESKGVLGKIRAQLRASVFLALEEQDGSEGKIQLVNPELKKFLNTSEGRLVTGLVREFLEYFDLDFSIAVFDPETNFSDKYPGRNNLARELKLNDVDNTSGSPLLAEVLKRLSPVTNGEVKTSPRHSAANSPRSISPPNSNKISSPRPSKIPQRVRDEKSSKSDKNQDSLLEKLNSDKELNSLSDSRRDKSGNRSPDVTIASDDGDDIFADIPLKTKESEKQGLMKETGSKSTGGLSSLKGAPSLGSSGLGSLKGAPPLPGMNNNNREASKSPNWQDLADIDNKISKLGFDIPDDDKNGQAADYNDDYEDDFHTSDMSIPEDIEEQLSLLNGYFTSDRTVSQASGEDLDFAEDILNF
ncbi:FGFR1 oncogene partner-like isoform X2 [Stylophora pistillata]|uniref:FGFR1 oncogene partner n=1 Tax=Stylophora pistillata TaxID=50429 RepID=A0A2B4RK04_STYPI|nr:FGFR1 oncogene partner-like isoform X2 [Stylophora pistillata]PFX16820.1 FGFR1 oncogene partner [Stylophora pistillata]